MKGKLDTMYFQGLRMLLYSLRHGFISLDIQQILRNGVVVLHIFRLHEILIKK